MEKKAAYHPEAENQLLQEAAEGSRGGLCRIIPALLTQAV